MHYVCCHLQKHLYGHNFWTKERRMMILIRGHVLWVKDYIYLSVRLSTYLSVSAHLSICPSVCQRALHVSHRGQLLTVTGDCSCLVIILRCKAIWKFQHYVYHHHHPSSFSEDERLSVNWWYGYNKFSLAKRFRGPCCVEIYLFSQCFTFHNCTA